MQQLSFDCFLFKDRDIYSALLLKAQQQHVFVNRLFRFLKPPGERSHHYPPMANLEFKVRRPSYPQYKKNSECYIPGNLERIVFPMKIGIHCIMVTVITIAL